MPFRKLPITLVGVGIGGEEVKPHVRKNLGLPPSMGGIKARLGWDSII
jgi:hypothetical protein